MKEFWLVFQIAQWPAHAFQYISYINSAIVSWECCLYSAVMTGTVVLG